MPTVIESIKGNWSSNDFNRPPFLGFFSASDIGLINAAVAAGQLNFLPPGSSLRLSASDATNGKAYTLTGVGAAAAFASVDGGGITAKLTGTPGAGNVLTASVPAGYVADLAIVRDIATAPVTVASGSQVASLNYTQVSGDTGHNLTPTAAAIKAIGAAIAVPAVPNVLLAKFATAIAATKAGSANTRVLMVGNSTTLGSGATGTSGYVAGTRAAGPAVRLAALLATQFGVSARADGIIGAGAQANYPVYDSRVSYPVAGFTSGTLLNNAIGGTFRSTVNGSSLAFTPATAWTHAKVFYATSSTQGTFSVDINGGASTPVNAAGATGLASVTISAAKGLNTLNITKTNATGIYILGIETWDSTTAEIEVIQAGWAGAKATDICQSANPWDGLNEIAALQPHLTILDIEVNDAIAATAIGDTATAGTYTYLLNNAITVAKGYGSVLVTTGPPSAITSASLAQQLTYRDAARALAASTGCEFLDLFALWTSYEASTSLYTDSLHNNGTGYQAWMAAEKNILATA